MPLPEPQPNVAAAMLQAHYWSRIERLIRAAAHAGRDLAVTSPRFEKSDGGDYTYNVVWEHQMLEPGAVPLSRPDQTWHVYRCAGGVRHG